MKQARRDQPSSTMSSNKNSANNNVLANICEKIRLQKNLKNGRRSTNTNGRTCYFYARRYETWKIGMWKKGDSLATHNP